MTPSSAKKPRRRALLSVSEKDGIVDFARTLVAAGFEIISTGGTHKALSDAGVPVVSAEDITKFPECFGGRVKTMHPLLMGGILFKREDKTQVKEAEKLGIMPIDIVVVNLYPFEKTAADTAKTEAEIIEQIDIGGPTLLRSAAKNHASVTVVCDRRDYDRVSGEIQKNGMTSPELRAELAEKVFVHTAAYDAHIAGYLGMNRGIILTDGQKLRYGENPHQWGEFYAIHGAPAKRWKQLQGKELSYLNLLDGDAAWRMVCDFVAPTTVMVKHANPSGIASDATIESAFQKAYDTDRLSAFGVIIALNRACTKDIAQKIIDQKIFVEVILAPVFDPDALEVLTSKPNIRLLSMGDTRFSDNIIYCSAFGGMLVQNDDVREVTSSNLTCVTKRKPTKEEISDLLFAWKVVKHAKSNAIVLAKESVTVGIGCGQTSRVDATWIALKRAQEKAKNSVLASDAFFPFPDAIEEAAKQGIAAIIQPAGSVKDAEVFARADALGIAMVTTGIRAFRH